VTVAGTHYVPPKLGPQDFILVGPNHITAVSQQFGDRVDADLLKTAFQRTSRTIGVVTGVAIWEVEACYPDCVPSTPDESWANQAGNLGKAVLLNSETGEFVVTRDLKAILALASGKRGYATGVTLPDGSVSSKLPDTPGKFAILVAPEDVSEQLMTPAAEIFGDDNGGGRPLASLAFAAVLALGAIVLLRKS
jgi:hypothetical protein